jgi:hypothetical protein
MQADQNNYQPDKRFTDQGWSEMLKTLDKEIPVQEKKRRGFFWIFAFLLMGGVASVWTFYPNHQKVEIAGSREAILSQIENKSQSSETSLGNNLEIENQSILSENKIPKTKYRQSENNKATLEDNFPSIIKSLNPLLPQVIEELSPVEKNEIFEEKAPLAELEDEVLLIDPNFITIELQKREVLVMEEKEFFFEEEIIKNSAPIQRKIEFGIYAGVVGDFANIKKSGLMTGVSVHFPMGKKMGLKTGLGYSQLQKELPFYFIGNQDAALSNEFLNEVLNVPSFSSVVVQSSSGFILKKFHQLEIPVLLTYSPIKKLEFQLGANASYLIKDQKKLTNNNLSINESINDDYATYGIELGALDLTSISQSQYADENYWTKLNVSAVAGLAWKPTRRINLQLQYHHGFLPILKSNRDSGADYLAGATIDGVFEVFDNSVANDPGNIPQLFNQSLEKGYPREKFMKKNYSIRFSIGYNF